MLALEGGRCNSPNKFRIGKSETFWAKKYDRPQPNFGSAIFTLIGASRLDQKILDFTDAAEWRFC
jgi:hypothetical protein